MGAVQDRPRRDRGLPMAVLADIFPASTQLVTASPSAFVADKAVWPALLKQICLAGLLCLERLPELLEAYPFLLAHFCRPFPLVRLLYHFSCPLIRTISCGRLTYHDNHILICCSLVALWAEQGKSGENPVQARC